MAALRLPDSGPVRPVPANPPEPENSPAAWALFHEIMSTHEGRNALISASYELPFSTVRDALNALEPVVGGAESNEVRPPFARASTSQEFDPSGSGVREAQPPAFRQEAASVAGPRPVRKKTIAEEAADGNVSNLHPDWGYFAQGPIPKADVDWRVNPFINTLGSAGNLVLNPIVGALSAIEPYTPALDNLAMTLPGSMGPAGIVGAAGLRTLSQLAKFASRVRDEVPIVRPVEKVGEKVVEPAAEMRVPNAAAAPANAVSPSVAATVELGSLPMDTAARMARAREMGFRLNMRLFHGTNNSFPGFELGRAGSMTGTLPSRQGVWFAVDDADVAEEFAKMAVQKYGGQAQIYPVFHRAEKAGRITLRGKELNHEVAATIADAWDKGFDAILFRNAGAPGRQGTTSYLVVRDPAQLRSPNAKFDPAHRDSNDLLAEIATILGGGTAAASAVRDEMPNDAKYVSPRTNP